jgi:hypothetical protein
MDPQQREQVILSEILQGNLPSFLRKLIPVELEQLDHGKTLRATVFVMPDYLAIGSDDDFFENPRESLHGYRNCCAVWVRPADQENR